MKCSWIPVLALGLLFSTPVFAHDYDDHRTDRRGAGAYDREYDGRSGMRDVRRMHREARRDEVRRHFAARARAKHHMYHRARARAYAEEAREAAARARGHAARAHRW